MLRDGNALLLFPVGEISGWKTIATAQPKLENTAFLVTISAGAMLPRLETHSLE
jgi:hypothetical protein